MNPRSVVVGFLTVIAIIAGVILIARNDISLPFGNKAPVDQIQLNLDDPVQTTHYQNSSPAHGQVFAEVPAKIAIHTAQVITTDSKLTIEYEGVDFTQGMTEASNDVLIGSMKSDSPDGTYTVSYTTCIDLNDCENGKFQFVLDRSQQESYEDLTGQESVIVTMEKDVLNPQSIIIDTGTVVMWANASESETYAVASAPVPSRAVFPALNAAEIRIGETYSALFEGIGEYEYYDRLNTDSVITGRIIVR